MLLTRFYRHSFGVEITLAFVIATSTACASPPAQPETLSARGVLIGLTQRTFSELETIDVRTDDGEILRFRIEGDPGLTPGHAREHMSFVEPVTVYYRQTAGGPLAFSIVD